MYFESPRKGKGNARCAPNSPEIMAPPRLRHRAPRTPRVYRTSENQVVRPGEQDLYIKLTYSVIREDMNKDPAHPGDSDDKQKKPPKWHMSTFRAIGCRRWNKVHLRYAL